MNCEFLYSTLENANSAAEPKVNAVNQTSTITSPLLPTVVPWFDNLQVHACAHALCLSVWALTNFYYSSLLPTESYSRDADADGVSGEDKASHFIHGHAGVEHSLGHSWVSMHLFWRNSFLKGILGEPLPGMKFYLL